MKNKNLLSCVLFFYILFNCISAGSLGGSGTTPPYYAFQPFNNVFYNGQFAQGVVRMDNGFTVTVATGVGRTHGSSIILDTCLSVSGAIDLRNTNTIILLSDLKLDNGATFSSGGRIYGYDRAVILGGDLTIPAGKIIHIGGRIAIDGHGNKLILGKSAELFVDAGSTLTLRNLVLQNTQNNPGNPPILCGAGGTAAYCSNLCLDNVELALASNFYFNRGQMFIHNDVAVTGTSALVYRSCQPSFITSGAHLYFDVGTTFSFTPSTFTDCPYSVASTTTTNNFIHMADATSTLILNGSSFFTTTTGLRLTTGTVLFDNRVTLQSKASFDLASTNTSPVAFIHSATTSSGATAGSWSPDGRFLAACGTSYLQVFRFSESGNPTQVGSTITSGLEAVRSVTWSPWGRYIAVVNQNSFTLQIFSFSGFGNPTQVGGSISTASNPISVAWSPDGRFIAVANNGGNTVQVFGVNYIVDRTSQALSQSIVFGNSALGSSYDATVDFLSGSNVLLNGEVNFDNVN